VLEESRRTCGGSKVRTAGWSCEVSNDETSDATAPDRGSEGGNVSCRLVVRGLAAWYAGQVRLTVERPALWLDCVCLLRLPEGSGMEPCRLASPLPLSEVCGGGRGGFQCEAGSDWVCD
jgi:hypothetical protein